MRLILLHLLMAAAVGLSACPALLADVADTTRPSDLALEVEALRAMDDLQITTSQLDQFRDAYASAHGFNNTQVADVRDIDSAAADNRACQTTLVRLRESLLKGDPAGVEQGEKDLARLEEELQISLTPRIMPGPIAQRSAVKLLSQFSGRQIADYVARHNEEVSDPAEVLIAALTQCRGMKAGDFQLFKLDVATQVSELVAGVGSRTKGTIEIRAMNLLQMAHALDDDDFAGQRSNLEDEAREVAKVDSSTALQHWMEWEIAQLLANPKLLLTMSDRSLWAGQTASNSEEEK
jgi:hypothetical protein